MKHLYFLTVLIFYSFPAYAVSCNDLNDFLAGLAGARAVQPALTASSAKKSLQSDSSLSNDEKRVLSKYIDRAFSKSDPAEGAFVSIDRGDCKK